MKIFLGQKERDSKEKEIAKREIVCIFQCHSEERSDEESYGVIACFCQTFLI